VQYLDAALVKGRIKSNQMPVTLLALAKDACRGANEGGRPPAKGPMWGGWAGTARRRLGQGCEAISRYITE